MENVLILHMPFRSERARGILKGEYERAQAKSSLSLKLTSLVTFLFRDKKVTPIEFERVNNKTQTKRDVPIPYAEQNKRLVGRGAPRSESEIHMIAGGNHTSTNSTRVSDPYNLKSRIARGGHPRLKICPQLPVEAENFRCGQPDEKIPSTHAV